jgi:hypothetical protein
MVSLMVAGVVVVGLLLVVVVGKSVVGLLLMVVIGKPLVSVVGLLLLVAMTPLTHVRPRTTCGRPSRTHTWLL